MTPNDAIRRSSRRACYAADAPRHAAGAICRATLMLRRYDILPPRCCALFMMIRHDAADTPCRYATRHDAIRHAASL